MEFARSSNLASRASASMREQVAGIENEDGLMGHFHLAPPVGNVAQDLQPVYRPSSQQIEEAPPAELCLAQFVLDWEFLHDLDLHLLKLNPTPAGRPPAASSAEVPGGAAAAADIQGLSVSDFIDAATGDLRLYERGEERYKLEKIVSYNEKVYFDYDRMQKRCLPMPGDAIGEPAAEPPASGANDSSRFATLCRENAHRKAVLQLDRNATVHSVKPVENMWITRCIEPGFYVVGVHNYCMRALHENVGRYGQYTDLDDLKKRHPIFVSIEKAQQKQELHADDEDATSHKEEVMHEVDVAMTNACHQLQDLGYANLGREHGVHYGVTCYQYKYEAMEVDCAPSAGEAQPSSTVGRSSSSSSSSAAPPPQVAPATTEPRRLSTSSSVKHPQTCNEDEIETWFDSSFFMTSECVYDDSAKGRYNAITQLAERATEDGKKAIPHNWGAHVCIFKVVADESSCDADYANANTGQKSLDGSRKSLQSGDHPMSEVSNGTGRKFPTLRKSVEEASKDGLLPRRTRIAEFRILSGVPFNAPLERPGFVRGAYPEGRRGMNPMEAHRMRRMRGTVSGASVPFNMVPPAVPEDDNDVSMSWGLSGVFSSRSRRTAAEPDAERSASNSERLGSRVVDPASMNLSFDGNQ